MDSFLIKLVVLAICGHFALSQENAGTSIAPSLEECYNNTLYVTRDYRLPSSISVLVELIRKIEDASPNLDARELSYQLLHRFRQDGIKKTSREVDSSLGLPYSPKGWEAYKNRVQLKKLTPGNAITFNNDSITPLEACSLHFMVSSTIETQTRGDEGSTCSRLSHYTSRIRKRQVELTESDYSKSSCPIESGVIYTKWGAVKAGLVLSGIAAGFQPNPVKTTNGTVESSYASTIAGELSEVALYESSLSKTLGNSGGWNSTIVPKYYFVNSNTRENLYLTDAEIRGGFDGLYMALNIPDWKNKNSNIKISQILDLYYGRGLFNNGSIRACNRKELVKNLMGDNNKLITQTALFNYLLNEESLDSYSPSKSAFITMATEAVSSLQNYINSNLNDLTCQAEDDVLARVSADLLIFVDTAWNYQTIQSVVATILDNADVNSYESSYTIFDGVNCNKIVNKSRSILDFYEQFNLTQLQKYPSGFNYVKVLQVAQNLLTAKLNNETDLTGQATIVMLLPHSTPTTSQKESSVTLLNEMKQILPDLRVIVAGSGDKSSYSDLVVNNNADVFTVADNTEDSSLKEVGKSVVSRVQQIPRNVVDPSCGSSFTSDGAHNFEVNQYVEPAAVNYHKVAPNYYYNGQTVKVQGLGYGTLAVCMSTTDPNVRANTTNAECKNVVSDEYSKDITGYCTDKSVTECPPLYISVQGLDSQNRCTDTACRFPDSIKYTIKLENVECSSSAEKLFSSLLVVSTLFAVMRF
jgi:hypothetical protein